jgi:hypothetical protein
MEEMVIGLDVEVESLPRLIYLINSGVQRIKNLSTTSTPDMHDQKTIRLGQDLVKQLCNEYRACSVPEKEAI